VVVGLVEDLAVNGGGRRFVWVVIGRRGGRESGLGRARGKAGTFCDSALVVGANRLTRN
jgi:hypothetical protein